MQISSLFKKGPKFIFLCAQLHTCMYEKMSHSAQLMLDNCQVWSLYLHLVLIVLSGKIKYTDLPAEDAPHTLKLRIFQQQKRKHFQIFHCIDPDKISLKHRSHTSNILILYP